MKLFTSVYVPKEPGTYPILLSRTPYSVSPYGTETYKDAVGPSDLFQKEGYTFVYQDVRGRLKSEGEFVNVRPYLPKKGPKDVDEATDTWDTIDWLVKNVKGNNGKVGIWGISYPGYYALYALLESHPALKAVSPQAPIGDWFLGDDFHHNGAFYLPHAFNFFAAFGTETPGTSTRRSRRRTPESRTRSSWGPGATAAGRGARATRWATSASLTRPASSTARRSSFPSSSTT